MDSTNTHVAAPQVAALPTYADTNPRPPHGSQLSRFIRPTYSPLPSQLGRTNSISGGSQRKDRCKMVLPKRSPSHIRV